MRPKAVGTYIDLNADPHRIPQRVSNIEWSRSMFISRGDKRSTHGRLHDPQQQKGNAQ